MREQRQRRPDAFDAHHKSRPMLTPDCRGLFGIPEDVTYVDHGSFGLCPREVLSSRVRMLQNIEEAPGAFFAFDYRDAWRDVAAQVACRFSADPQDVALIENATDGINSVLRSLSLDDGDEILITSLAYGAVALAARHIAARQRAHVRPILLRFPDPEPQECIEAVAVALTSRTKLAILDHVTSSTALVLPVEEMTKVCHEHGIPVLVDGAHVPGNIALKVASVGADWYTANLHKWSFAPRGCGFLWAASGRHDGLVPTVLSWDIGNAFPQSFEWTGTRDPTPWLSIPSAFRFIERFGDEAIRNHNHTLLKQATALLSESWRTRPGTPESMIGSMALLPLPVELPFAATPDGCAELRQILWKTHRIVANPSFAHDGRIWLRVSAQIYNVMADYEKLADVISRMCVGK